MRAALGFLTPFGGATTPTPAALPWFPVVGAGIGVTPFASILKHIWYRQRAGALGALRRVEFFWVCRDVPSFGWFQALLQEIEAAQTDRECFVLFI